MTSQFATLEGTEKFFRFHAIHSDKKRQLENLWVSALGVGTYLGDSDDKTDHFYERALVSAVSHGINFFDTANNYRGGRSEKVLGKVLKELEDLGISRDQIVISTKGGFLPCDDDPENFETYTRSHYIEKGIIGLNDIIEHCHCLSPRFIEHELEKSLRHLGLSCLDIYYIHNPETQFSEITENEFDERIYKVFELMEQKVKENKIRRYGLATWNGFRLKPGSKALLNLPKLVGFARKIAGDKHHFKALQLPYNLVMLEAIKMRNQNSLVKDEEEKISLLKSAKEHKINVMISAPLMQSQLLNLPRRIFDSLPSQTTSLQKALQFVLSTPDVTSAMVGMKSASHVHENVKVMQEPNWSDQEMKDAFKLLGA
jgi:aryl-alcohol dehydrogenase-like predicted oxidoreductase